MKPIHIGVFSLPAAPQPHDPALPEPLRKYARAGYGGRAMALASDGMSLWVSGHDVGDLVARWSIPQHGEPSQLLFAYHELAPRDALNAAQLDQLVGVAELDGKLFGLYQDYYDVDGVDGGRVSLWNGERLVQVGRGRLKQHAGYLASHDGTLWSGRSDGAGSADVQHGPRLLRQYTDGGSGWRDYEIPPRADWTEADRYTGLVFLPGHVCWIVSKDVIPRREEIRDGKRVISHPWYGPPVSPEGLEDKWNSAKGWHTESRQVWLLMYTWPALKPLPPRRLEEFHESAKCGGIAYDAVRRLLYVHQLWPPERDAQSDVWNRPQIHVYGVDPEAPPATEPEPAREILVTYPGEERPVRYDNTPEGRLELVHDVSDRSIAVSSELPTFEVP